MVALKHKARLLLHWHHICFGLAYMAGTSQHYNAGIMFWAWQSTLWMENLFYRALYKVLGRKVVCSLQSCHLSLFKWTVFFLPVPFFPVHMGVTLSSWKAGFLSWFCPRNALVLFFYYHNTFSPSIVYLYTDSSYFYTHCKTINKSLSNAGLKNGNGTWKRKWKIKGVFSNWRIIELLWHFFFLHVFVILLCTYNTILQWSH